MEPPITRDDVFEMPHPRAELREPDVATLWYVTEFFKSGAGEEKASIRSLDGRHFATIDVAPRTYTAKNGDGEEVEHRTFSLAEATTVQRGGRAAAQRRFDIHHELFLKRHAIDSAIEERPEVDALTRAAATAKQKGDKAAHAKAERDRRILLHKLRNADPNWVVADGAMKRHCDAAGLRLHHV